jgi:hypothetical protein
VCLKVKQGAKLGHNFGVSMRGYFVGRIWGCLRAQIGHKFWGCLRAHLSDV